jgi:GNAT superfamily N-acetyltransferase
MNILENYECKLALIEGSDLIIQILKQVAGWMKDNGIDQWRYLLEGGDDNEIIEAVVNKNTYIVIKDSEIIATFTLSTTQSEWDKHIFGEDVLGNAFYLHRLAILPTYMNQDLGKNILTWIQENNKSGKEYLKLNCVAGNIKLNNFYKCNGFDYIGETDNHSKYQKKMNNKEYCFEVH